ncbi:MFS transporter [Streptomyces cinereoruber]|uniref:MFS transporter n=1 Tax=Streptomyces cinereoruber TaxID=67260 RepID=UPI0036582766
MLDVQQEESARSVSARRLPLGGLLALTATGFITVMLETLPAGILPTISNDLAISEAAAGQTVTLFAVGCIVGAIPLIAATRAWSRRRLLLLGLGGYVVTSLVTSLSAHFLLTLVSRFVTGVFAGTLWALIAGVAMRMGAPTRQGKALTIAMAGTPLAFAIGTPGGTSLAEMIGWRSTFALMALLAAAVMFWALRAVPEYPGQGGGEHTALTAALRVPGVARIAVVTLLVLTAHSALFTYVALFLRSAGLDAAVGGVLLLFGVMSVLAVWVTGRFIDGRPRMLLIAGLVLLLAAACCLFIPEASFVVIGAGLWGLAFGGIPTLIQGAAAKAAGSAADAVQSVIVTGFNLGIAGGGVAGGLLLGSGGTSTLAGGAMTLVLAALLVVLAGRRHAFPRR